MSRYPWRQFAILFLAGWLAALAVIPYQLELMSSTDTTKALPLALVLIGAIVNTGLEVAVAVGIGLLAARAVGLRAPLSEAIAYRGNVREAIKGLDVWRAAALGVAATVAIVALDLTVFRAASEAFSRSGVANPSRLAGFFASFSGGITEELLLRLLVMSVLAWLLTRVWKPAPAIFWAANAGAAILFGLGHLPTTAALVTLTPLVVLRAIVLNGVLGVVAGWLYWRRGLESAMVAHFSGDLVLHVVLGG